MAIRSSKRSARTYHLQIQEKRTYQAVIGLEFHVHLATQTKMFCSCEVTYGEEPNTHTCPVCLGHPGALPVINEKAVELGVMAGLALNCEVAPRAVFARKNYFYPDLPKGYQISQYDAPMNVHVGTSGRMHGSVGSLIDFNRGGTPLIEIVTEPDIPSPEAARATANHLKAILQSIGVSEADMEKGQLRCDANVSIRKPDGAFGTKTELKNMNSFRFVERGLARELERQRNILEGGSPVEQATIHYDPVTDEVHELRSKEYAHDYRYFPEPDLLPLELTAAWVREVKSRLPELPEQRRARFVEQYGLSEYDAGVLTADMELAAFYEKVSTKADPKQAANWVSGELRARLNEAGVRVAESKVEPGHLIELIDLLKSGVVSRSAAKDVLNTVFETGDSPTVIVEREGLASVSGEELSGMVDEVIAANPNEAGRVRAGDKKVIGFLVGQVMRASGGNADGGRVRQLLVEKLNG